MDVARDLALALDETLLMREVGLTPDPWQAQVLRSTGQRILLNCCRQSGKSTVSAVLAVHTALYQPASLVLLLSPTLRQSQELFRKCLNVYRLVASDVPPESETKLTLELANGSRIVSLPGKEGTIRGFSGVSLLVVDEAARVPDELYYSVRPMLAVSHGRLVALSTPFGTRGWWYEAWRSTDPWERYTITAAQCPRISSEFLAEEKRALGEWWFRQEYFCEFLDAQTQAFSRDLIERAFGEVETWTF
ncbi:terminase large subunit domain-containing protein [Anaerolinea sp.]|uniref:terminase large subunit domain-containing protein n=1 Tax=Anaerolinea sp. TaxID=1872519 RepID=UPI002ACE8113|nr:terminase family protein [Anaerolinea sp.]